MKKELLDAQRRFSNITTEIDQWSPHNPDINAFDTSNLETAYGQSNRMGQIGQAMYAAAMDKLQETVDDFKGRLGLLESEAYEHEQQLASDDSQTRAAASYALERNLTAQAKQGRDVSEGSPIATQQKVLSAMGDANSATAGQVAAMGSEESLNTRTSYYNDILSGNQSMVNALQGQAGGIKGMADLGGKMGALGLDAFGKSASAIENNKLALLGQYDKHSGMQAKALEHRLGSAATMAGAGRSAYSATEKAKMKADRIRTSQRRTKVLGALGGAGATISHLYRAGKKKSGGK